MHENIEHIIEIWNNFIIPKKENAENLIAELSKIEDRKSIITQYFQISKIFKNLTELSKSKKRMAEHLIQLHNKNEDQLLLELIEEKNNFQWKSIYYQEKGRRMIKDMNLIKSNHGFFNDIFHEYYWFIDEKKNIRSEEQIFDYLSPTPCFGLNIILNNLSYFQMGIRWLINHFENKNDFENLFLYHEVEGDINILKFLLMKKIYDKAAGMTYLYFAIKSYQCSIKFKYLSERKEIYREGIVGFEYQDILYRLFEEEGIRSGLNEVNSKLQYINQYFNFNYDIQDYSITLNEKKVDYKIPVLKKIDKHLEEIGFNNSVLDSHDRAWNLLLEWIGLQLITSINRTYYFRKWAAEWSNENEMDLWFVDKLLSFSDKNNLSYPQEAIAGGGKCEHFINDIPIEDKIIDHSKFIKMKDFLEEQYKDYYPQTRQYALAKSKYSMILITDRRAGVMKGDIPASAPQNCMLFKKDEENNIWCAIVAFQVFLMPPSHLKL